MKKSKNTDCIKHENRMYELKRNKLAKLYNNQISQKHLNELIKQWDFDNDYIKTQEDALLKFEKIKCYLEATNSGINTAKGLYYVKKISNGLYPISSLILFDGKIERTVFLDIVLLTHSHLTINSYYRESKEILIFYDRITKAEYFIDTTGYIYFIGQYTLDIDKGASHCEYKQHLDLNKGKYIITRSYSTFTPSYHYVRDDIPIYEFAYQNKQERQKNIEKTYAHSDLYINEKFFEFIAKTKKEKSTYLYFSLGYKNELSSNRKDTIVFEYLCKKYNNYEVIPNIFLDDKSLNVRFKLPNENNKKYNMLDIYYLCTDYYSLKSNNMPSLSCKNYCIYNISIHNYMKAFNLSPFTSDQDLDIYYTCVSVMNTIKEQLSLDNIEEVKEKILNPIYRYMLNTPKKKTYKNNCFEPIHKIPPRYNRPNVRHIGTPIQEIILSQFKKLQKHKAKLFDEAILSGVVIRKWKNEFELFRMIKSIYTDAIFQYRAKWLGLQSIDIYIPSLKTGIEYQGEQHYMPIDFFGGEDGLKHTKIKDEEKRQKCIANNVNLIYWKYDEMMTSLTLKEKLKNVKSRNE